MLLDMPSLQIERSTDLRWALGRFETGGDFADMIHLATIAEVDEFATFDRKLARLAGADMRVPITLLGV